MRSTHIDPDASQQMSEHHLSSIFEHSIRLRGAKGHAYVPVVACGNNALSLHYTANKQTLENGKLIMMDAGAEFGGYVSDITRTWPINGQFSEGQKSLYGIVLSIHRECVKSLATRMSLDDIHQLSETLFAVKLKSLFKRHVFMDEVRRLYPHHISHHIGLDVHDCPSVSRSENLKNGMVVTIGKKKKIPIMF